MYIKKLVNEESSNIWAVGYNSILPKIMFEEDNKELMIITK